MEVNFMSWPRPKTHSRARLHCTEDKNYLFWLDQFAKSFNHRKGLSKCVIFYTPFEFGVKYLRYSSFVLRRPSQWFMTGLLAFDSAEKPRSFLTTICELMNHSTDRGFIFVCRLFAGLTRVESRFSTEDIFICRDLILMKVSVNLQGNL